MKKSTFLLSVAAMTAITASAASMQAVDLRTAEQFSISNETVFAAPTATPKTMNKAPKKISAVSDLYGFYEYNTFEWRNRENLDLSFEIVAGPSANEVILRGLYYNFIDVVAGVDLDAQKVILRPYDTGYYLSDYGENLHFQPFKFVPTDEEGMMSIENVDALELSILEDGTLEFPTIKEGDSIYPSGFMYDLVANQGYFVLIAGGNFVPIEMVNINLDEWTSVGTGKFSESLFNTLLEYYDQPIVEPYDVEVMCNKNNKDMYLIVDPYKGTRFDNETIGLMNMSPNASGYMMIDASYPDCILVQPLIGAGFGYTYDNAGNWTDICVFNMEAMLVREGYDPEDVMYEYAGNDELASYMEDDVMYFYHMRFSMVDLNPLGIYNWVTQPDAQGNQYPLPTIEGTLTLDRAGVEGIQVDSNAPVKYFNLQGVEIANPEKGQLVIKKQGSQAKKMIVR